MFDCKGRKVEPGMLLFANKGKYGPCAKVLSIKGDMATVAHGTLIGEHFCEHLFYERNRNPFLINAESMRSSYWSVYQSPFQEICSFFRVEWYRAKYEFLQNLKNDSRLCT